MLGLRAIAPLELDIGRLGRLDAEPGWLLYVGSALGPGGLRARLGRHLSGGEVRRWHIDHLRAVCSPEAAWWATGRRRREHRWAQALLRLEGAQVPLARFGASDCRCESHLVWLPRLPPLEDTLGARTQVWLADQDPPPI